VLYATPQLLGVHTVGGGHRVFALTQRVEAVYNLFARQMLARDVDRFEIDLAPASTALFFTGQADLLDLLGSPI